MTKRNRLLIWTTWVLSIAAATSIAAAKKPATPGAVYTMTNAAAGNSVLLFDRMPDGSLAEAGMFPTGGQGTGSGLGNQGGVVLSPDNRWLIVVNAGSNDISVFAVEEDGLQLVDRVPSGGLMPVSISVDRNLLYVLNAGGSAGASDNITGFEINPNGTLAELPGSTAALSAAATGPAQIGFTPDGRVLIVTEKATNRIDTFTVGRDGYTTSMRVYASLGITPFGFAFGHRGQLFVSEAFPGMTNASAVSSYIVSPDGTLTIVSPSVGTNQTAACWVVVSGGSRFAYTTNAASDSISGYKIGFDGEITLLAPDGRTGETGAGSGPIDMALSTDGRYLYVLGGGNGTIGAFRVGSKGALDPVSISSASGLPATANGLAAR